MHRIALSAIVLVSLGCSSPEKGEEALTDVIVDARIDNSSNGQNDPTNHPPKLHKIGNKEVQIGESLELILKADDEDEDTLTYSVYGDLPDGSKFFKPEGRFTWTPEETVGPLFVTFVVSDMRDFDSETVEFRAVSEKTQHSPTFEPLGDQFLNPEELYQLQLEATDEDGDTLRYTALGSIPDGAFLDSTTGFFRWTPSQGDSGTIVRITFQVSDGALTDTLEVRLIVKGDQLENSPPDVKPLDSMEVSVGQLLQFELEVTDPDDDPLTVSVAGQLPPGASFNSQTLTFQWTPDAAYAGKSIHLVFEVTDGLYEVKTAANIWVRNASSGCADDEFEPNNVPTAAQTISSGQFSGLSICDTELSPVDIDWFKIMLNTEQEVNASIQFDHDQGDLELALFEESNLEQPVAHNPGVSDTESLSWKATSATNYYLVVFGVGSGVFSAPYSMSLAIETSTGPCSEDALEPNNTAGNESQIPVSAQDGTPITNLSICPGDLDRFSIDLGCGDTFVAAINFENNDGDLDLHLIAPNGQKEDSSLSSLDYETVGLEGVTLPGKWVVEVVGYPKDSTENTYDAEFLLETGDSCSEDTLETDNSPQDATAVSQNQDFDELTICCDDDWFLMAPPGGTVSVEIVYSDPGQLTAAFVTGPEDSDPIALSCGSGLCEGSADLSENPTTYLRVQGSHGTGYMLTFDFEHGDEQSCTNHCDDSVGDCWCDDTCFQYGDCCPDVCSACGYCST